MPLPLQLSGRFNRFNAVTVIAAAAPPGADVRTAVEALGQLAPVGRRFSTVPFEGRELRFLLAKNPAEPRPNLERQG